MKDPEVAELEATARRKPLAAEKPCRYCGVPIHWEAVGEGDDARTLPYEADGVRHFCEEYSAAKKKERPLHNKAVVLLRALVDLFPDLLDEL